MNPESGRIFGGRNSSTADVSEGGGSAVECSAGRVEKGIKRKDRPLPAAEGETRSTVEHKKRASAPATVKVEGGASESAVSGAAETVRRVMCAAVVCGCSTIAPRNTSTLPNACYLEDVTKGSIGKTRRCSPTDR